MVNKTKIPLSIIPIISTRNTSNPKKANIITARYGITKIAEDILTGVAA